MAQLTENVRVHFPLCFQDEGIIAANSLNERATAVKGVLHSCNEEYSVKMVGGSYTYYTKMIKLEMANMASNGQYGKLNAWINSLRL